MSSRNRTPSLDIDYALYLYFLGLSTRKVAKALSFLNIVKRSHVSIWNWIQENQPKRISSKRKKISQIIVVFL
jgi:putative transposase